MVAERCAVYLENGSPPRIRLSGSLQSEASAEIEEAFRQVTTRCHPTVEIDAAGVTEADDRGVQALVTGIRDAEARGVTVTLRHASRQLRNALRRLQSELPPALPETAGEYDTRLSLPCIPQSVGTIRAHVMDLASRLPFSAAEVEDIALAVGEAAGNAVRHGQRAGRDGELLVHCHADPLGLAVEITDPGDGFDPEALRRPDPNRQRAGGLGIYLMRRIMDEVTYTFDARGTTVRLVKHRGAPVGPV